MFQKATRIKLRFATAKGNMSVENLWDLSVSSLKTMLLDLHNMERHEVALLAISPSDEVQKNLELAQLRFEIVKAIIAAKEDEVLEKQNEIKRRATLNRIAQVIAEKENESLASKSLQELQEMRAALEGKK